MYLTKAEPIKIKLSFLLNNIGDQLVHFLFKFHLLWRLTSRNIAILIAPNQNLYTNESLRREENIIK